MKRLAKPFGYLAVPLLAAVGLACAPNPPPTASAWKDKKPETFVGSAACQPCHPAEFDSHRRTRHATTISEATLADLGKNSPQTGPIPGGCKLQVGEDGTLAVDAPSSGGAGREALPLTFALGSGKTGLTFLSIVREGSVELHESYFPKDRTWRTTPGQETFTEGEVGRNYRVPETRRCLSCHVVAVPEDPIDLDRKFFGVGCESCHGPGGEHVERMKTLPTGQKPATLGIDSLTRLTGDGANALCGKCHRTASDVSGMKAFEKDSTNRFQPYGLSLSRCFKESGGTLTCVTCHSPHADAGTDPKPYETACLSCHAGSGSKGKPCPVNPTTRCVACHMPTRPAMKNNPLPIAMADHFIRVYKNRR